MTGRKDSDCSDIIERRQVAPSRLHVFPGARRRRERAAAGANTFYGRMLCEDVRHQVIPYSTGRGHGRLIVFEPEPAEAALRQIHYGFASRYARVRPREALEDWLREAATSLVLAGLVAYELSFLTSAATGDDVGFRLRRLRLGSYYHRFGRHYEKILGDEEG